MHKPSFIERARKSTALIYDLRATVGGERRYFIIEVAPAKKDAFLKSVKKDTGMRLEDYGRILHRGWDEPSQELKAQLNDEYGLYE